MLTLPQISSEIKIPFISLETSLLKIKTVKSAISPKLQQKSVTLMTNDKGAAAKL